jgi:damage-control phosphatase, subfamily III
MRKPLLHSAKIKGSFAEFTINSRFPKIFNSVFPDMDYEFHIKNTKIRDGLTNQNINKIKFLLQQTIDYSDYSIHDFFHEASFFLAEFYFYHHMQSLANYEKTLIDHWKPMKEKDFLSRTQNIETFYGLFKNKEMSHENFRRQILFAVSGNSEDLSLLETRNKNHSFVIDDSDRLYNYIQKGGHERFDIFCDNSGNELLADISLALFLIGSEKVGKIYFHFKPSPIFVSDALSDDFDFIVMNVSEEIRSYIKELISENKIILETNEFWDNPLFYSEMPFDLKNELSNSDLWIVKGDLNYRRFVEDRLWANDQDIHDICSYLPANALLLRVIKSEVLVSVNNDLFKSIKEESPDFQINGKWGLIQFV